MTARRTHHAPPAGRPPSRGLGPVLLALVWLSGGCVSKEINVGDAPAADAGPGCEEGRLRCSGAVLQRCSDGSFDALSECDSAALCERSVSDGASACTEATCEPDEGSCGGGQTDTFAQRCRADGSGLDATPCEGEASQCNPATGACIALRVDATEVTRAAYAEFLGDPEAAGEAPAGCAWNDDFAPDADCMAGDDVCQGDDCGEHPQVCVDFCDALAFCAAQGRRLCGRIDPGNSAGAGVPFDQAANPGVSQWMNACSSGGQSDFAFDAPVNDMPCNYAGVPLDGTHPVGAREACHAVSRGYVELYDLSGNVAEWEDACDRPVDDAAAGPQDVCRVRGGAFDSELDALRCAELPSVPMRRDARDARVGFRCCG
jgi:hypothetical protein